MAKAFDPFTKPELLKETSRYREIAALDAIYCGKQYEGRANWWTGKHRDGDEEKPLRERKPCIVYRLPKAATQQAVRFLFGEGRFPQVSVEVSEEAEEGYPVVSEEDADELTEWVAALVEHGNLQPNMRAIATKAIACKTAVVVLEVDRGEFRVTLPRPQDCWALFEDDDPSHDVKRLLWCYEFDKEVADESGKPTIKRHLFRREWDKQNVYVYEDVEIKHGVEIEWGTPVATPHKLSFCPVLWIRNEAEYCQGIDGNSLYEGLGEEFEALDLALSRRHQGIIYLGAPQLVETGEDYEEAPDATGRTAGEDPTHVQRATKHGTVRSSARRTGPEYVWRYKGKDISVELLETTGKAFEVGTAHVNDIRSRILETMGIVLTSMADTVSRVTVGAEMSARFLALAHAPLIALVQEYRHTWWPHGLRRVLSMMMRMVVELDEAERIVIPGTASAAKILQRFNVDGWTTPRMSPHWGKFFEPAPGELKEGVDAAVSAKDGRVISEKTAIEYVAHDFGVESVELEIDEIEGDVEAAAEKATDDLARETEVLHGITKSIGGEDAGGNRGGGGKEPPKDAGGRGGGFGAAAKKARRRGKRGGRAKPKGAPG